MRRTPWSRYKHQDSTHDRAMNTRSSSNLLSVLIARDVRSQYYRGLVFDTIPLLEPTALRTSSIAASTLGALGHPTRSSPDQPHRCVGEGCKLMQRCLQSSLHTGKPMHAVVLG